MQVELLAVSLNKIINKYFIPYTKQCLSTVQTARLVMFGYIIAVYCENHTKAWIEWEKCGMSVLKQVLCIRGVQIFQRSRCYLLKILGTRQVAWGKLHTEDSQISGATVQNAVAWATRRPGFAYRHIRKWSRGIDPRPFHKGLIVNKVSLGKGFLQVLWIYDVIVIPPMLHTPVSFMYHRHYVILAGDRVVSTKYVSFCVP